MNFEVRTHKQPTRQKKVADVQHIIKDDISTIDSNVIKVIPNMFMGENNDIPVSNMYVDSQGDIIKMGMCGASRIVEVELCDKSLAEIEALCSLNISDDTNIRNSSGITRVRVNIATTDVDICKVSLGTYRNYIQYNEKFIALNTKQKRVTYQDSRNKTVYDSVIYCAPENKDAIISLIKQLNKSVIEWY